MPSRHLIRDNLIAAVAWIDNYHYPIAALPAAVSTALFGAHGNEVVKYAFSFILFDLATGFLKAASWKILSSQIATLGLRKKVGFVMVIVFGHLVDQYLGTNQTCKSFLAQYVIGVEAVSILENLAASGVVLPERVSALIKTMMDRQSESAEESIQKGLAAKKEG